MRSIRGAICAKDNSRESIYRATQHLLGTIVERNNLDTEAVVAAFFTMTPDLNAEFPAYAARDMGWTNVAMLGAQESLVPGGMERASRVLLLAEGTGSNRHVYLGRASAMRPDLAEAGDAEAWDAPAETSPRAAESGRLLVIGLGLIGGSLAVAVRHAGLFASVCGYDRDPNAAAVALNRGLVERTGDDLGAELAEADIVVIATPVAEIVHQLRAFDGKLKAGCIVTDVGSTKKAIVEAMNNLSGSARGVGGHPMAGDTRSGPAGARADLFAGARWAVVETETSDEDAVHRVERLARAVGATPLRMTADLHDRLVASTSGMPALLAAALVCLIDAERAGRPDDALLIGPGFTSASRLAAGSPAMTAQMLSSNAANLRSSIDTTIAILKDLAADLEGDPISLTARLEEVRSLRNSMVAAASDQL